MSSWWGKLAEFWNEVIPKENCYTITFDNTVKICNTNILSKRIFDHGGGRTSIPEAFVEFEKYLANVPKEDNVTVIFISDGEDNNINTLDARMKKL
jgi:hypothetical protein